MIVIDCLDEWLDFAALSLTCFGHAARDLGWVAFYAGNEGVGEWMCLGSGIERLNNDNLD